MSIKDYRDYNERKNFKIQQIDEEQNVVQKTTRTMGAIPKDKVFGYGFVKYDEEFGIVLGDNAKKLINANNKLRKECIKRTGNDPSDLQKINRQIIEREVDSIYFKMDCHRHNVVTYYMEDALWMMFNSMEDLCNIVRDKYKALNPKDSDKKINKKFSNIAELAGWFKGERNPVLLASILELQIERDFEKNLEKSGLKKPVKPQKIKMNNKIDYGRFMD